MEEPGTKPRRLKRYTNLAVALDMLRGQRICLVSPAFWTDKNDTFLIDKYKESKGFKFIGAVCMTEANETFHHWKIFADGMDGICIEFDKEKLEECLNKAAGIQYGNVNYLKLDQVAKTDISELEKLPFIKRAGYKDEREYRIIHGSHSAIDRFDISFSAECINRIILSPFLPVGLADATKKTLKEIEICRDRRIVKSHLINSATWQKGWSRRLAGGEA